MKEYDIEKLVGDIDFEGMQYEEVGKGVFLTKHEIEVLKQNHIAYQNCSNLKEVLFEIEEVLQDMEIVDEELDLISSTIAERDYYQNTNK